MIAALLALAVPLTPPPPFQDTPPPAYVITTTRFRCQGPERSVSIRTFRGRDSVTQLRSDNRDIPRAAWRAIQATFARYDSVGSPQTICSARGDTLYLTANRGAEADLLMLIFTAGSAMLADER
jgi:hypothetical protein